MLYLVGTKEIKTLTLKAIASWQPAEKRILDFPAGSGFSSDALAQKGADVTSWDAFPSFFKGSQPGTSCEFADLQAPFPAQESTFDHGLFQEGIEHLPNQLFALKEFHRVLKDDGTLLVTTPNYSNLRSRVAYLFFESETPKMFPPNEVESIWYGDDQKLYYGHIFSTGIMRLRLLGLLAGFEIAKIHPSRLNGSSLLFGIPLIPVIFLKTLFSYLRNVRKKPQHRTLYRELFWLNLHPSVLLGGHLIVEFKKTSQARVLVSEQQIVRT